MLQVFFCEDAIAIAIFRCDICSVVTTRVRYYTGSVVYVGSIDYLRGMKCLVMVRVSTEAQRLEDQHDEMVRFCNGEGYDDIVFVEDKGASAIKMDDQYRLMIRQVKSEIERDPEIRCFAVWELSRAFRNELVFQEVKQFLVERGIQFLVKSPYLKLLDPDGTVNPGMEVAVTLMATLAKQEMQVKKERFRRAKEAMRRQGKFTGGTVRYGYRVDDAGYIVIDEEQAKVVRLVFELYSTGRYSIMDVYEELRSRGYEVKYSYLNRMVSERVYVDPPYPQMISEDLWKRCEKVRKEHVISVPRGRRYCFGTGVFRCHVCGRKMVAEGEQYRCWHHNRASAPPHCSNGLTVRVENLDGLLWMVASMEEIKYRYRMDASRREEIKGEIEVLREKVETARRNLSSLSEKRVRIADLYEEGYITKDEAKKRRNKTLSDERMYNDTILKFEEKIEGFLTALRANEEEVPNPEFIKDVYLGVLKESELKEMDAIVKRHISVVTAVAISQIAEIASSQSQTARELYKRKSAQVITVETVYSGVKKFIYVARQYKGHYFYTVDGVPLWTLRKIVRPPLGELSPRAFKKVGKGSRK